MEASIFYLIYMAFVKGLAHACCVLQLTCEQHGPMPDGSNIPSDSCSVPTVQIHCDCEKFGWRKP